MDYLQQSDILLGMDHRKWDSKIPLGLNEFEKPLSPSLNPNSETETLNIEAWL